MLHRPPCVMFNGPDILYSLGSLGQTLSLTFAPLLEDTR